MFKAYEYFTAKEAEKGEYGLPVYRVTGLSRLEDLVRNVRETSFPCIVVDYGADGILDLDDRIRNQGYHTVHFLDSIDTHAADTDGIFPILDEMFELGKATMLQMAADRYAPDMTLGPCYGFTPATIRYSATGPIGLQAYGYTFNYEMNRDHE